MQNALNFVSRIVMDFLNFQSSMIVLVTIFIRSVIGKVTTSDMKKTMTTKAILGVPTCTII